MSREISRSAECVVYAINLDCNCGCDTGEITATVRVWPGADADSVDTVEATCLTYGLQHHLTAEMAREARIAACMEAMREYHASARLRREWAVDQPNQPRRLSAYFVAPSTRWERN